MESVTAKDAKVVQSYFPHQMHQKSLTTTVHNIKVKQDTKVAFYFVDIDLEV